MTGFDIIVLLVVGISALLAFARGFVREALSMVALAAAILAVVWGFPVFREPVRSFIEPGWLADVVTIAVIFAVVYIGIRVLTGRIHEWVHDSEPLGILDRTAGLLFGVARGFLLLAVALLGVTAIAPPSMLPKSLTQAQFYPFVMITADALKHLAPQASGAAGNMVRDAGEAGAGMAKGAMGNAIADAAQKAAAERAQRALETAGNAMAGGVAGERPSPRDTDTVPSWSLDAEASSGQKAPAERERNSP